MTLASYRTVEENMVGGEKIKEPIGQEVDGVSHIGVDVIKNNDRKGGTQ